MIMKRRKRRQGSKPTSPPTPKIPSDVEKPAGASVALAGADRRTHPRYEFIAAVQVVVAKSGARIETRVRDLSQQGCYVDTNNPVPRQNSGSTELHPFNNATGLCASC